MTGSLPKQKLYSVGFIAALLILFLWIIWNAVWLWPELEIGKHALNDQVLHQSIAANMAGAFLAGENPIDNWFSPISLGYPISRTYQPLSHLLSAAVHFASLQSLSLECALLWVHFLALVLFPCSIFLSSRLLGLSLRQSTAAAVFSLLISTPGLYGLEFGSYVWRGSGLFSQSVAMNLLPLSLGATAICIQGRNRLLWPALLLSLTFLSHFLYGYIAAVSIVLLVIFLPGDGVRRLIRLLGLAVLTLGMTLFQVLPLLLDQPWINRSQWEYSWKWDSFGLPEVVRILLSGQLLDYGRWPVLTLFLLVGIAVCARQFFSRSTSDTTGSSEWTLKFLLIGWLFWMAVWAGRPAWGPLLSLFGAGELWHLHRLIGGVHVFSILLCGAGFGRLLSFTGKRRNLPLSLGCLLVLFIPIQERAQFLGENAALGARNLQAQRTEPEWGQALKWAGHEKGRVYAGLAAGWGKKLSLGEVPFYAHLARAGIPALSFLYHSMSLGSDAMTRFREEREEHYRLFGISAVIAPSDWKAPDFLTEAENNGKYRKWRPPHQPAYFDVISVPFAATCNRARFHQLNSAWLEGPWPGRRIHWALDFDGRAGHLPRLPDDRETLHQGPATGRVLVSKRQGEEYSATVETADPAFLLFKMSFHPGWRARVNGRETSTFLVTPGFLAIPVPEGKSGVVLRYEPERWRAFLLLLGLLLPAGTFLAGRRVASGWKRSGRADRLRDFLEGISKWLRSHPAEVTLLLLVLPLSSVLWTGDVIIGHDGWQYPLRLIEFDANIQAGILLPRWAPDLSRGTGQPLFLFNPPLLYYLAEIPHLLGMSAPASLNLICCLTIFISALGMFCLARYLLGAWPGVVAAVAYVYAPYFLVNLLVRQALAEFLAFALYPLILYGLVRHAREGRRRLLALPTLALSALLLTHHPASLLFAPGLVFVVICLTAEHRSFRRAGEQIVCLFFSAAMGTVAWLPALVEKGEVQLHRLLTGPLQYVNHFVHPYQLIKPNWGFGLSVPGAEDEMSFSLGWAALLLGTLALILERHLDARSQHPRAFAGVLVLALWILALSYLMTPPSRVIWDSFSLLQYVQFPWRMLGPTALFMALVAALGCSYLGVLSGRPRAAAAVSLFLLALAGAGRARAQGYAVFEEQAWTPERIAARGARVTTLSEYAPRAVQFPPRSVRPALRLVSGRARFDDLETSPESWSAQIVAAENSTMEAFLAYYPGWQVRLDGRPLVIDVYSPTGLIRFEVPSGSHELSIDFERSLVQTAGGLVTVGAAAFFLLWMAGLPTGRGPRHRRRSPSTA